MSNEELWERITRLYYGLAAFGGVIIALLLLLIAGRYGLLAAIGCWVVGFAIIFAVSWRADVVNSSSGKEAGQ